MLSLQANGIYPQTFAVLSAPTLMIHGNWDPHPGRTTLDTLLRYMPQIEYVELTSCGHYPWRERYAREPFFHQLRQWLGMYMT